MGTEVREQAAATQADGQVTREALVLVAGIILFIIGAAVAVLSNDLNVKKLGYVVALIGVGVILIWIVLEAVDEGGKGDELGLILPGAFGWALGNAKDSLLRR